MPSAGRTTGWSAPLLLLVITLVGGTTATAVVDHRELITFRWPVAGFVVAAVTLAPRHRWPVVALGVAAVTTVVRAAGDQPLGISIAYGIAVACGAVVAALVLTRGRADEPAALDTQEDFLRLLVAAMAGGVVAAGLDALAIIVLLDTPSVLTDLGAAYGGHSAAILVTVPAALTFADPRQHSRVGELFVQAAATAAATAVVFAPGQELPLAFLPLPLLVWAALRFGVRTVAIEVLLFGVLTTFLTSRGSGPFGAALEAGLVESDGANGMRQVYLVCVVVLTLPLAIAVEQRALLLARVSANEQLFRRNFTESLVGMVLMRQQGDSLAIVDANETASRVLGSTREVLVGRDLDALLVVEGEVPATINRVRPSGPHGWRGHAEVAARPGSRVDVAVSLLSEDGPTRIWSAQLLDVTAEQDARRRLENAEKLTSATLDTTACIILVTDVDGRIVRANAATTDITGYAAGELIGRRLWETPIAAADASDVKALFGWSEHPAGPGSRERDLLAKGGERLRIDWRSNIVRDESGAPAYAVLTGIDVTAERASAGLVGHLMRASFGTALVGIDAAGRVTVFNSGAQHLLGYTGDEIVGRPFTRIFDHDELLARTGAASLAEAFELLVAVVRDDGETRARDWTWVTRSGHRQTVSMTLSAAENSIASQIDFLCVGRDVTEQRQSQEMVVAALDKERTAVERLRFLDEAKNEFVSTVSHELRTPVTSIVGYTEMLSDGSVVDPDPAQVPLLESIARNGQRLIVICNDLLLLSGLDADNLEWKREPVDLAEALAPAEESIRPLLIGRGLEVAFDPPPGPVEVLGDRSQLDRVLLNLLSNAVKFTEDGGSVLCRLETEGSEAVITVRDTGIGIPLAEQDGLFQKFFRSSTAQSRAIQGTGLGLSIVAAIVAGHGGHISVESAHLAGTTFTLRLPLA